MVLNIAHRGARSLAPENTIAAARKAWQLGADLWETDIGVTADEQLILFHDDSLSRTTDAEQSFPDRRPPWVGEFTLAEIRSLSPGIRFIESDPFGQIAAGAVSPGELVDLACEKVATLEEALIFTQEANWRVNLELKRIATPMNQFPVVEQVLALIDRLNVRPDHVLLSSFNHDWLRQAKTLKPKLEVQALIGIFDTVPLDWGEFEFETYNARSTLLDEEQIRVAAEHGAVVNVFTLNEESEWGRFVAAGAAGIFTDFPQGLAAFLSEMPGPPA